MILREGNTGIKRGLHNGRLLPVLTEYASNRSAREYANHELPTSCQPSWFAHHYPSQPHSLPLPDHAHHPSEPITGPLFTSPSRGFESGTSARTPSVSALGYPGAHGPDHHGAESKNMLEQDIISETPRVGLVKPGPPSPSRTEEEYISVWRPVDSLPCSWLSL